jgi:hypothetical protein
VGNRTSFHEMSRKILNFKKITTDI